MTKAKSPMTFFATKEPQSVLKHAVLEGYLREWCKIIANNFDHLYYVDGFSGPGYYGDEKECSPAIAARVMMEAAAGKSRRPAITTWHVEKDKDVYAKLQEDIRKISSAVDVRTFLGEFHDHLPTILQEVRADRCPVFFFIDPFGFSGVQYSDLELVNDALRDRDGISHAEVLVNYATCVYSPMAYGG